MRQLFTLNVSSASVDLSVGMYAHEDEAIAAGNQLIHDIRKAEAEAHGSDWYDHPEVIQAAESVYGIDLGQAIAVFVIQFDDGRPTNRVNILDPLTPVQSAA